MGDTSSFKFRHRPLDGAFRPAFRSSNSLSAAVCTQTVPQKRAERPALTGQRHLLETKKSSCVNEFLRKILLIFFNSRLFTISCVFSFPYPQLTDTLINKIWAKTLRFGPFFDIIKCNAIRCFLMPPAPSQGAALRRARPLPALFSGAGSQSTGMEEFHEPSR